MMELIEKKPKVSVCVVTYNQEKYIRQCLQSIVDQETDFDFEVIVGDDCSTDGTRAIVQEFADKYPLIVKPVLHVMNVGATKNYFSVHEMAEGEYVAHMDGDDYSLQGKLSLQAKYLDEKLDCAMVFHRCLSLYSDKKLIPADGSIEFNGPCNFAEFLYFYPSSSWHSSKMYRRSANLERKFFPEKFIDKHIHFEHGLSGLVGFINKDLGVYRVGVGISSNIKSIQDMALESYEYAIQLGYNQKIIQKIIAREQFEHSLRLLERHDFSGFQEYVKIGFNSGYKSASSQLAYYFRFSPRFYVYLRNFIRRLRNGLN